MGLLRKLTVAGLVALVTAEPRQLGFSASDFKEELSKLPKLPLHAFTSDVSVDSSGAGLSPMSILSGAMNEAKAQFASNADTLSRSSSSDSSNPFSNSLTQPPAVSNAGLGGPDLTAKTGSDIMQGMIRSFLANKKLDSGEEQCLEQGCGAIGSSAASVSSNVAVLANQVIASPVTAASPPSESRYDQDASFVSQADATITQAPNPAPSFWNSDVATTSAAPQSDNMAFSLFGTSQGRRLESIEPMMMLGMAGYGMSLGKEVQNLANLGHQVMSKCLLSDGKDTLATAAQHAENPQFLLKSLKSNGVDAVGDLAKALDSWKSADASSFGANIGSVLREVFLDSQSEALPEGLPSKDTMGNITGGLLSGLFGDGSATIKTPESTWTVDLNKCVGNNLGLMHEMYGSLFGHLAKRALDGSGNSSSSALSSSSVTPTTKWMYVMMQLPAALKQCGIGSEQEEALKDAFESAGKGLSLDVDLPEGGSMSKTQAAREAADTVSGYGNLVADPSTASDFGKKLGQRLQQALTLVNKKYYVDKSGHLRNRLTQLSANNGVLGDVASIITPMLLALTMVLFSLVLISIRRRRPVQDHNFLDLESAAPVE